MTWSYDPWHIPASAKDQVRLNIGDTVVDDWQLTDEEISAFLAARPSIFGACADACRSLAAKYSRSVTMKANGAAANFSDLSKAYTRMATQFEQRASATGGGTPFAGGIRVSDKVRQDEDTDRVKPQFNIGMDDNNLLPYGPAENETEEGATRASE